MGLTRDRARTLERRATTTIRQRSQDFAAYLEA
jgi:hypothetical protein